MMNWSRLTSFAKGYPAALAAVLLVALILLPFRPVLSSPTIMLLCVPVIVIIARSCGLWVSTVAAAFAFLLLDVLFVSPYYHINVAEPSEWIALTVFLAVALVSGQQTARLRERELSALRRQEQLELLNRLTMSIALEGSSRSTADFIVQHLSSVLPVSRVALYAPGPDDRTLTPLAESGTTEDPADEVETVSRVMAERAPRGLELTSGYITVVKGAPAATTASSCTTGRTVYVPLLTPESVKGVLCVTPSRQATLGPEDTELLASIANLAAASLNREHLADASARAAAQREAERLRTTFVSSVSHELKTPLAAATARVTGLVDEGVGCDTTRVHLELIEVAEDLGQLNMLIGDLLDLSRLESDAWLPNFEPTDLRDVLGTVLARVPPAQRERVRFMIAENLPGVRADASQLTRALSNIVENALVYSPPESPVTITAGVHGTVVRVSIEDEGPGVAPHERMRIFDRAYRGSAAAASPSGTGLGLAISREILRSHDARLWVESASPKGARFIVSLPLLKEENRP